MARGILFEILFLRQNRLTSFPGFAVGCVEGLQ